MPDIVLLRVRPEATHRHVLQHPLTVRMGRGSSRDSIHGKFLSVEGTPPSAGDAAPPKASQILLYVTPSDPPAERVRAMVESRWKRVPDRGTNPPFPPGSSNAGFRHEPTFARLGGGKIGFQRASAHSLSVEGRNPGHPLAAFHCPQRAASSCERTGRLASPDSRQWIHALGGNAA